MKEARGVKRGRKVLDFTEYCNKTTRRIDELKLILINTDATEEKRKQVRNQISAFQARLKQRMNCMDKELRIEQKHQQLSSMLTVLKNFMDPSKIN